MKLAMEERSLGGPEFRYRTKYPRGDEGPPSRKATADSSVSEEVERETTATFESRSAAGKKAAAARDARGIPHFTRKIAI